MKIMFENAVFEANEDYKSGVRAARQGAQKNEGCSHAWAQGYESGKIWDHFLPSGADALLAAETDLVLYGTEPDGRTVIAVFDGALKEEDIRRTEELAAQYGW